MQSSFRGQESENRARIFETMPQFPLFSGEEGKNGVAWVTGSYPSMNLTVVVIN